MKDETQENPPFRRDEINALEGRIRSLMVDGTSPVWLEIYRNLLKALNRLDVALTRSEVK